MPALLPRDMVRSGMPHRAFPVRAAAYPSSNDDGRVTMVVLFEPVDPSATMAAASFAVSDVPGRVVARSTANAEDLHAELPHSVPDGAMTAVRFEVSRTPDGPALGSMPAMLPPSPTPGRIATAAVPIAGLPAADDIVRARVTVDGEAVGEARAEAVPNLTQ